MKKALLFVAGFILGSLLFGFLWALNPPMGAPYLRVLNISESIITQVNIHSDDGSSYSSPDLAQGQSTQIKANGADQLIRFSCQLPDGRTLRSERVYISSGYRVLAIITKAGITLDLQIGG